MNILSSTKTFSMFPRTLYFCPEGRLFLFERVARINVRGCQSLSVWVRVCPWPIIVVKKILAEGIIIEEYQEDYPLPSVLISGIAHGNRPLHAVVAIDDESRRLYLITIYEPDPERWSENFSRRK